MRFNAKLLGAIATTTALVSTSAFAAVQPAAAQATPVPRVVISDWSGMGGVARATCPSGTGLVGGGVQGELVANTVDQVTDGLEANAPDETIPNTWKTQEKKGRSRAVALCAPDAPVPLVVASDWSAPAEVARANCPPGTALVGGGQDARLVSTLVGTVNDDVEANAPNVDNAQQWTVQLKKGQARAFALCLADAPVPTIVASAWSNQAETAYARCPDGTGLVGGGQDARLVTSLAGNMTDAVEENAPDQYIPNTWKVNLAKGQARAFALCVAGAPVPTVAVSPMGAARQLVKATCPAGTALIGGGFDTLLHKNGFDVVTDAVETSAPSPDEPNTWMAKAYRDNAQAYAMCTP
ncbi:hypothetical protein [Saccharothrix syringae]|uniref:Uncharacterized protein n=1 Tax=Saccharothrix syringae TaxID=103733 RepID=A0A5Q0GZB9_SACSY|nr:hypothetical protein [Saccharothrix syringae]QFZ18884.1 hypothetical protein EKG83_16780 [Saccharothrix syringae]